jgi:hypothetical protein
LVIDLMGLSRFAVSAVSVELAACLALAVTSKRANCSGDSPER